jgi:hypothetical protein
MSPRDIPRAEAGDLVVHAVAERPLIAYRIVKILNRNDPALLDAFRSNYELGAHPRGLETESALIHLGLSMYLRPEMAVATARRWPRIGAYIAQVQLVHGKGFCWARTAQPGHITVWGRPSQLIKSVADILPMIFCP